MTFEISDWVQGKTVDGEFVHGYIETVGPQQEIVRVRVVQSDNPKAIGRTIALRGPWLKQLPVNPLGDQKNLESLIDLALSTSDETWFQELTDQLNALNTKKHKGARDLRIKGSVVNRLGLYENK
ncbi:hypothetical protein GRF59_26620 [Paenibacillus sp. HJL G12]|uniref:IDEAL domain-containing protein n=1 Tax=Paenibacillus dendrobii TaxID=2691084 RepID=A0A7X3IP91_9BACL|nr:hypothetical protein [Paenibacillus dendrobii]MWV47173.1 hypothetical protein [Paenibacillus dendrobii]